MAVFAKVHLISPAEAQDIMVDGDPIVLDVRTPKEYASGHIEGAINLPLDDLNDHTAKAALPNKNREVVVYCKSGVRSSIACGMLSEMGYDEIHDMIGGIDAWPFGTV